MKVLHWGPTKIGLLTALSTSGFVLGALVNERVVARLGPGRLIAFSGIMSSVFLLGIPAAPLSHPAPVIVLTSIGGTVLGFFANVNQLTLRQSITPPRLLGRMNSVVRFMYWGTIPAGSAIGGALAGPLGLRTTLFVAGSGAVLACVPIALSPIRKLRVLPEGRSPSPRSRSSRSSPIPRDQPAPQRRLRPPLGRAVDQPARLAGLAARAPARRGHRTPRVRVPRRAARRVEMLPFLLFALPAGVWVDRLARRPILVAARLGRALRTRLRPARGGDRARDHLAALRRRIRDGTLTVFFDVAYQSYLPSLVARSSSSRELEARAQPLRRADRAAPASPAS